MKKYNRNLIVLLRVVYQIFLFFAKVAPHSAKIVIFIEYFVEICIVEGKKEICGQTCVSEKKENESRRGFYRYG